MTEIETDAYIWVFGSILLSPVLHIRESWVNKSWCIWSKFWTRYINL